MKGLVVVDGRIAVGDVGEAAPREGEVLVEVRHVSVNYGEARFAAAFGEGVVVGFDAAGVVLKSGPGGPPEGARVVAFGAGAWAERAVFAADAVAVVPEGLTLADAAALPMVGLTALRVLRGFGALLGRRVLVTGASGGLGRVAVQLARRAGAHVVAAVRTEAAGRGLAELGAHEVVVGLDGVAPVHAVIESVGGPLLVQAWGLLLPGGSLRSVGWASGEPATFPVNGFFAHGDARTLASFGDTSAPGADLAYLAELAARGDLDPGVTYRADWTEAADVAAALLARRITGKAVLDLPAAGAVSR
ncbi:zinc-binding dehydrogenase [Actinocorallia sp. API 0066]|uniref:zinc-binding dehydrogenase n=1 Tax=Actinocorallia sp. API 0066 TaxID=2896846 RepID=UPI001E487286|nr:zinc-binding dehydrogenase [Actinocorallia sp. API 0066]MCD0448901.1 zinc-binding dehydrogenase [Actinocorallia sp. API 0066]